MTKQEALEILDWIPTKGDEVDAMEMAIEALSCSEEPNRSDTIYRQDAIDALKEIDLYKNNTVGQLGVLKSILAIELLPSSQQNLVNDSQGFSQGDLISRQDFDKFLEDAEKEAVKNRKYVFASALNTIRGNLRNFPSAQPDNRLAKIADLVEGTIDHFDLDDAMDLLYQIKEVLKNG